jgi:hypothetical protein
MFQTGPCRLLPEIFTETTEFVFESFQSYNTHGLQSRTERRYVSRADMGVCHLVPVSMSDMKAIGG